jgi:ERCC4-type nuclease
MTNINWISANDLNDGMGGRSVFSQNSQKKPTIEYTKKAKERELVMVIDSKEDERLVTKIEQRMRALCLKPEEKIRRAEMNLFDVQFVIKDDPRNTNFGPCFERKTASDLASSIKDGRYTEQKRRMQLIENMPATNKVYIYEGNLIAKWYGVDPKALLNASLLPPMRNEAEIQMTQNMDATADILVEWLLYLEHLEEAKLVSRFSYAGSVQTGVKKKDVRDNNRLALMLSEFAYGISGPAGDSIAREFDNSLAKLQMDFIDNQAKTLKRIANCKYKVNGKDTKVGPAAAKQVLSNLDIDRLRLLMQQAEDKKSGTRSNKRSKVVCDALDNDDDDDDDDDDDNDDNGDNEHNHNNANNNDFASALGQIPDEDMLRALNDAEHT